MSNHIVFGLYSAGGFGREVMPVLTERVALEAQFDPDATHAVYFIETTPVSQEINGYPIISEDDFFELECSKRYFSIAVGDSKIRKRLAETCIARGAKPMSVQSPRSTIYDANELGDGAIICANAMITSNAKIGKFFHLNIYSYVAHDCVVGDYVTFAPGVHCNGNVHVHDHAYIGTGAIIRQGTSDKPLVIGEGATVGMGAVVTKDVPAFTTVMGNPAKPYTKG